MASPLALLVCLAALLPGSSAGAPSTGGLSATAAPAPGTPRSDVPGPTVTARGAAGAPINPEALQRRTLEDAVALAGLRKAGLPIVLAPEPHEDASDGVEAWTLFDEDDRPMRIEVYTKSDTFVCANQLHYAPKQCVLKLASILVHEAWHFRNGRDESGAYEAQIVFLVGQGARPTTVQGVRRSLDQVKAARKRPLLAASAGR